MSNKKNAIPHEVRYTVLGLPVVLALVAVALFAWGRPGFDLAQATGPGPQMSLGAEGSTVMCDDRGKPTKCRALFLPGNEKAAGFQITVNASVPPDDGYAGFGSEVVFGGLTWNPRAACEDEVVWPDLAGICSRAAGPAGQPRHAGGTATTPPFPKSNHAGTLIEVDVHCPSEGQFKVSLTAAAPSAPFGAAYIDLDGATVTVKVQDTQDLDLNGDTTATTVDVADTLQISCGPTLPTPTPCPSEGCPTPTPTATPTPCPTEGCPTPTPTATPTPCPTEGCPTPKATQAPTMTASPAVTPSPTPTPTLPAQPTPTPTPTPTLPAAPSPTPTATLTPTAQVAAGDVSCDGTVDSTDALLVLQLDAQLIDSLPCNGAADVYGDGVIDALDALFILQLDAGLIDGLPVGVAGGGWTAGLPRTASADSIDADRRLAGRGR